MAVTLIFNAAMIQQQLPVYDIKKKNQKHLDLKSAIKHDVFITRTFFEIKQLLRPKQADPMVTQIICAYSTKDLPP